MKQKRRFKFIAYIFLFAIASLSVGYSAFGTKMNITDIVAEIRVLKDIRVTGFNVNSATGNSISQYEEYNHNSVSSKVNMPQSDSTVTYNIQVTNIGNVEMGIYEFTGLPENMEIATGDGYKLQDAICDDQKCSLGAKKDISITIKYKDGGYNPATTEYNIKLDVDFRQMYSVSYEGIINHNYQTKVIEGGNVSVTFTQDIPKKVIPYVGGAKLSDYTYNNNQLTVENVSSDITLKYLEKVYMTTLAQATYFKETTYRTKILTAAFVDYIDTEGALATYDLGDTGYENEIIAWIDSDYNLYIGSDWTIYAKDLSNAFFAMSKLTTVSFDNLNTSEATTMESMFRNCIGMLNGNYHQLDTSNVTDMSNMFNRCRGDFDLTNFNTSKVTTMASMFQGNTQTDYINLSSFDTSNVTDMSSMFRSTTIESLDLSGFNTSKVTTMSYMFSGCSNLNELNLSSFNTSEVTNMSYMFQNCYSLTSLDLSHFNTSKVTTMAYMLAVTSSPSSPSALTYLNISGFDTSKVTNMSYMFSGNPLKTLDLSNFNTSKVTNMSYMFEDCNNLTELNLSNFNTSIVTNMSSLFRGCISLTNLDISNFNTSKVTNMSYMFSGCNVLSNIPTSQLVTTATTNMSGMFQYCTSVTSLDLTNFNTSKVTNMSNLFYGCNQLTNLNISNFNTTNVTNMAGMFYGCIFTNLNLSHFNTAKVTSMKEMFFNCQALTSINMDTWNTAKVTTFNHMFYNCKNLTSLNINHFNTSAAKEMSGMFSSCNSLTTLDLSNFNSTVLTSVTSMFNNCTSLTSLDLSSFTINSSITDFSYFLRDCNNLIDLKINSMDFTLVDTTKSGIINTFGNLNENIVVTVKDDTNKGIIEGLLTNGGTVKIA